MTELESKQGNKESGRLTEGEESRKPEFDSWDRETVPMLWFVGTYVVVQWFVERWVAAYLASGIGLFVGLMVVFRFRDRWARLPEFTKWLVFSLLVTVVVSVVHLGLSALWSLLFGKSK